jgi:hypothetical protein
MVRASIIGLAQTLFLLSVITLLLMPIALADSSCSLIVASQKSFSNYYNSNAVPYYATFQRVDYGRTIDDEDNRLFHAYYVNSDSGFVKYDYSSQPKDKYLYQKEPVFRSRTAQLEGFARLSTVMINDIDKVSNATIIKTPKKIFNSPNHYYYRPDKRTTLERPYYYYVLQKKQLTEEEVDDNEV